MRKILYSLLVLVLSSLSAFADTVHVYNQSEFDKLFEDIKSFITKHASDPQTASLNVYIHQGTYEIGSQSISYSKLKDANVSVIITRYGTDNVIITSKKSRYTKADSVGTTPDGKHYICNLKGETLSLPYFITDDFGREVELSRSGDLVSSGVNYVTSAPEVVDKDNNIARIGIPDELSFIKNKKKGTKDLQNPFFENTFLLVSTQWVRSFSTPLYTDSKYLYYRYSSGSSIYSGGKFDEALKKQTRFNIYNLKTSAVDANKCQISSGQVYVPINVSAINLPVSNSHLVIRNLNPRSFTITGINFTGITAKDFFLSVENSTNFQLTNNLFDGYCCSSFTSGAMVHVTSTDSFKSSLIIAGNEFRNSHAGAIYIVNMKDVNISNNTFDTAGTYNSCNIAFIRGCENFYLSKNTFKNCFNAHVYFAGSPYAATTDNIETMILERNEFYNDELFAKRYEELAISDMGVIYVPAARSISRIIRNNKIHDVQGYTNFRGIFLDDGACRVTVEGNLIYNASTSYAIDARYTTTAADQIGKETICTDNICRNNIVFGSIRWQGNKNNPNKNYVYNNYVQNKGKINSDNTFTNSTVDGDILSDDTSYINGDRIVMKTKLPFKVDKWVKKSVKKK